VVIHDSLLSIAAITSIFFSIAVIVFALHKTSEELGHFGQGLFGIVGALGFLVGAWLFYFQGSDRPRLKVDTTTTVAPLHPDSAGEGRVLIQLVNTVSNQGGFPAKYDCVAVDLRGFKLADELPRDPVFNYDVNTIRLFTPDLKNPQWPHCMKLEQERWDWRERSRIDRFHLPETAQRRFVQPDSGHRYDEFTLEAGESRTRDFELVVSCNYAAVRSHFVVPKPGNRSVHEHKTVISLAEACAKSLALPSPRPPQSRQPSRG
jgi:hypothetical protein